MDEESPPDEPSSRYVQDSVNWGKFHQSVKNAPGLKRNYNDKFGYRYNIEETRMNTDPFVRKSMKLWNEPFYGSLYGFSKKPKIEVALETLKKFSTREHKRSSMPDHFRKSYQRALLDARRVFMPHEKLTRWSVPDVCDGMNLNSAAGFSFPGKKKSEVVQEAYDTASYMAHMIAAGLHVYIPPCKLALRGHLSDETDYKTRPVWIYPFEINILEGKWAIPYYQFLEREVPTVHFGSKSMQRLAKMLVGGLANESECTEVTLDWSNFDSRVQNFMIDDAFDIIFQSFDETSVLHDGEQVFGGEHMARKQVLIKEWITTYFKKTKIMMPDGSIYQKTHGLPSGTYFTQAVGSIVNYLVVMTLNYYFGWNAQRVKVLGDDSSFLIPNGHGKVDPVKTADAAWEAFGFILKKEKLRIADRQNQRKFLGYSCESYRFERPTVDWFRMVLYPERDVQFLEQSASRVVAYYLIGGCNDYDYCSFFKDYLARYPILCGKTLPLTKGLQRLFKFVYRIPISSLVCPDYDNLDTMKVPFSLSMGDRPFGN